MLPVFLLCKLHGFLQNRVRDAARDAAARAGVFRNHDKGVRVLAVVEEPSEHRVRLAPAAQLGRTRLGADFQAGKGLLAVIGFHIVAHHLFQLTRCGRRHHPRLVFGVAEREGQADGVGRFLY